MTAFVLGMGLMVFAQTVQAPVDGGGIRAGLQPPQKRRLTMSDKHKVHAIGQKRPRRPCRGSPTTLPFGIGRLLPKNPSRNSRRIRTSARPRSYPRGRYIPTSLRARLARGPPGTCRRARI